MSKCRFFGNFWNYILLVGLLVFSVFLFLYSYRFFGLLVSVILVFLYLFQFNFFFFSVNILNFFLCFLVIWLLFFLQLSKSSYNMIYFSFLIIFLGVFLVNHFFLFFIFFEVSLIPTYFLVIGGSTPERSLAGKYLMLYTFLGSLPLFFSSMYLLLNNSGFFMEFFQGLSSVSFLLIVSAFLMKLPMFFFHLWLPKAHVEASTEGSMVLAGILLKLGAYGLFLCSPFFYNNVWLNFFIIIGGVYAGFFSFIQMDIKAFIAYSSILHMSFIVMAAFSDLNVGLSGIVLMCVGHGFVSAKMFFLLSMIYKETGSRKLLVMKSSSMNLGLFMFVFGLALILNSSAPLSMKFFGELFLFMSLVPSFNIWGFMGMFLANVVGGLLSMFLYLVFFHGKMNSKIYFMSLKDYQLGFFMKLFCVSSLIFLYQIMCKWT